ncbi:MAG: hypothetical protein GWM90_33480 [Gemmatimonadetes bacterium]|nr:heavy-metal-associated domain-containing protein [Gemmatimonadota bacterium]NIQ60243.1 heavy-metal-associated domain-containing protein [Gemmatimonadota bacterium]NIU80458.1 hypothetical protein [Gammaproteobacteria bacterium]NIX48789.1 hypothetical protein [Gemmatimonadota bacterium]NIY13245.1 hypothetical protein [Gemmatimonadota bacterium]
MATLLLRFDELEPADVPRVEALLLEMPGVFGAVASAAEDCAEVDFEDDEVDIDRLIERVQDAGFQAHISG